MRSISIAGGAFVLALLGLALAVGRFASDPPSDTAVASSTTVSATSLATEAQAHPGFLYGRITDRDGVTWQGRLRWGREEAGLEEAFWEDTFNGFKTENPWVGHVPDDRRPEKNRSVELFGAKIADWVRPLDLDRPFTARFGDIARIEARDADVHVTLKSGTTFVLDRRAANDFDDGVRVWDSTRGVTDLKSRQIRSIELLPAADSSATLDRLHGTVRTAAGSFTGFIRWGQTAGVGQDFLEGLTDDGKLSLRFDTIRSIERRSHDSAQITLLEGREILLDGDRHVGPRRRVSVDDRRHGRVLISWNAFERVDFSPGGRSPTYQDFPAGGPLLGHVTTRRGGSHTGRLVFDLDESEITETLDAPSRGVNYSIPFGWIASIVPGGSEDSEGQLTRVALQHGGELELEPSGDLGEENLGLLIFVEGRERPGYVPWAEVAKIEFDRPPESYPSDS